MPKLNLQAALLMVAESNVTCASCTAVAEEESPYCHSCDSYWKDCAAGLWDDEPGKEQSDACD